MSDHPHKPGHQAPPPPTGPRSPDEPWRDPDELRAGVDPAAVRSEFSGGTGPSDGPADAAEGITRRAFVQLLGASLATVGLAGCNTTTSPIVPYKQRPLDVTPGRPLHYATTMTLGGYGVGLLATAYEGRPTKLEGNPDHPASLGATSPLHQASVLQLYDPDRARFAMLSGEPRSVEAFGAALRQRLATLTANGGAGLRLLVEPDASPLRANLLAQIARRFPNARVYGWAALESTGFRDAAAALVGRPLEPVHDFARAQVVLALDADPFDRDPFALRYARAFARNRTPGADMNRLYVAEPSFTPTGTLADQRLRIGPAAVHALALEILAQLVEAGAALPGVTLPARPALAPEAKRFAAAVARDLVAHRGRGLVVAGEGQPAPVHALALAMNAALGNVGQTLQLVESGLPAIPSGPAALRQLVSEIQSGQVDTLVITAWNPVYSAPADIDLAAALARVPFCAYHGLYRDETAATARWFVAARHYLEAWSDARAPDGMVSLIQPLIAPLYGGLSEAELLARVAGQTDPSGYALLRDYWRQATGGLDFEATWDRWLQDGVVPNTALAPVTAAVDLRQLGPALQPPPVATGLQLRFVPDRRVYDGRFANNAWLQEMPEPIDKLTWDNAALLSPDTARRLDLENGDHIDLAWRGRTLRAWALIQPGHADDCVTVSLGYGRTSAGERLAREVGFNAYLLRVADAPWTASGVELRKAVGRHVLARTQEHWRMEGRPVALSVTAQELKGRVPEFAEMRTPPPSIYPPFPYDGYRWGMSIDMSRCTGCSACVIACQAENNVPVVGKKQVLKSREMHWLRVDRYFVGSPQDPRTINQPLMCVHCEQAPCEYVCPVYATVHNDEGLNEMVYNRCVGTRYCSNNCPYKVRRFNYLHWTAHLSPQESMQQNPQVTVRARGVMEKCSYCVQRIEAARIDSRIEDREIRDGEVVPACAQACPTEAIVFGDLNDPKARVVAVRDDPRAYALLNELGTRPRTLHLAQVRNANPELDDHA